MAADDLGEGVLVATGGEAIEQVGISNRDSGASGVSKEGNERSHPWPSLRNASVQRCNVRSNANPDKMNFQNSPYTTTI